MNLTAKRVEIGMFHARVEFIEHDYTQSLAIFLKERADIEANHAYIDPMTQVDLDYHEAINYFAVGNPEAATRAMESAIHFSKKNRIFYRIDDLYRLAAAQAMMTHDAEKKDHYLLKLKQYGDFAEDLMSILFFNLFQVRSLISEKHDYTKALELVDQYFADPKMADIFEFWYLLEKGKAFYGLERYHEAIYYLDKVKVPAYAHHPFDLSMFYIMDSYKALCHLKLGNRAEALQKAQTAVENFKPLPSTPFKDFAIETQAKIEKA
jgi:tetratricopeptide (TPR) repeat protein